MKALSIKQPFATFIIKGYKDREHRTWTTQFRGRFLIVSSKIPDKDFMNEYGINDWFFLYGMILGSAELYDVEDYGNGTKAFLLRNIKEYYKPINYKGQLSFFNIPYEVVRIQEQKQ